MRTLVRLALQFRTVTLLVVGLVLAAGALSAGQLEQELFPSVQPPFVVVTATLPDSAPQQVADDLAVPVEDAFRSTAGLEQVSSSSQEGFAVVFGEYAYGTDIDERLAELREALAAADLPDQASTPDVQSITPDALPIYSLALTGADQEEVRAFAREDLAPDLARVDGVADVTVSGADESVVDVVLDPAAVSAAGLTVADVAAALTAADLSVPVGAIEASRTQLPVRVTDRVDGAEAVADVLVPLPGGAPAAPPEAGASDTAAPEAGVPEAAPAPPQPVRVGDLGEVMPDARPAADTISRLDGEPAVTVAVLKEQDANTVSTVAELQQAVEDADAPGGVAVEEVVNQAPEIAQGVSDVTRDAVVGALLAIVMIVVFLRSWRGTIVAGISIPLSLIAAIALMNTFDISVNVLTLGALAVAAGRVIDDAIVVLENVYRNLELGMPRARAVRQGTGEVVGAVTSATLTAVAVFLPLAFVSGLAGEVFLGFALTTTFALLASLVVATTVVPVLGSLLLRVEEARKADPEHSPLRRMVRRPLRWALDHRGVTVAIALLALVGSLASLQAVPVNLFPTTDSDTVQVTVESAPGTALERTAEEVTELEARIAGIDGVERATTVVGTETDGGALAFGAGAGPDSAALTLTVADDGDSGAVREAVEAELDDLGLDGTVVEQQVVPGGSDLTVQVTGKDFAAVEETTRAVQVVVAEESDVTNVTSNLAETREEVVVTVDEAAAAPRGLDGQALAGLLRSQLNPIPTTTVDVGGDERAVRVLLDPEALDAPEDLEALPLPGGLTLGDVAAVETADGPTGITRSDGSRSAEVTGTIVAENIGAVTTDVQTALDDLDVPDGVTVAQVGANEQIAESFSSLFTVMAIAVVLVYLILVATFGSLTTPLVILLTLPLAAIGAFPLLAVTGRELGLPALIGLLMLIGIVVTNAIVLLEFVEQLRAQGRSTREALLEGAEIRVRPILMTALTTIFGLVPLALGLSEGALLSASLATVVIGGLVSSTLLTLVVIPVVYSLVDQVRGRFRRGVPETPAPAPAPAPAVPAPPAPAVPVSPARSSGGNGSTPVRVVGTFGTREEAEAALRRLVATGLAADRLAVRPRAAGGAARPVRDPATRLAEGWLRRRAPGLLASPDGTRYGVAVPDPLADSAERLVTPRRASGV